VGLWSYAKLITSFTGIIVSFASRFVVGQRICSLEFCGALVSLLKSSSKC
jgi:hypothetical protein